MDSSAFPKSPNVNGFETLAHEFIRFFSSNARSPAHVRDIIAREDDLLRSDGDPARRRLRPRLVSAKQFFSRTREILRVFLLSADMLRADICVRRILSTRAHRNVKNVHRLTAAAKKKIKSFDPPQNARPDVTDRVSGPYFIWVKLIFIVLERWPRAVCNHYYKNTSFEDVSFSRS